MKKLFFLTILILIVASVPFISGCKGGEEDFEPSGDKINVTINSNSAHSLYWAYNNLDYAIGNETIYQMLEGNAYAINRDESSFDFSIEFDEQAPNVCPLYYITAMTKKDGEIVNYDNHQIDKNEIISNFSFEDGKISFHASLKDKIPSGVMYIFVVNVRFNDTHEGNIYIGITGA